MSAPGHPKGEYRKAQPEGTPVNAARSPEGARTAVRRTDGFLVSGAVVRRVLWRVCWALCAGSIAAPAAAADDAAQLALGKQLFTQAVPACALCHALKDAGAEGAVGPALDELKPDASRVATALRNGIGQMPSYQGKLDDAQIAAIAAYVAKATGAAR